ncbi:4-(cytidine 5'-diphospho)-2-C-methyl-D-erythritol kinase [Ideonella sp.]|uniref:4-(cytidine 5'-diphospho)-2-C-methyl-D-erythritol kinase n=1 Tax=Ideonella sp. TaxID=1929293 RepID=UPI0037C0C80B
MTSLSDLAAPAKLNLFLHVLGRRADGYHLLESVFVLIDWADTLHLELRHDGQLQRHDLGPELPADDLCLRAARSLQQASGTSFGADISIFKHVPWGAGMGGGSSDAATTLLGLNRLWGLNWSREQLLSLGARLGADVPFFIGGHNAFVEGIGEKLTPIDVPPQRFAVIKPPQAIATAAIFSSDLVTRDTKPAIVSGSLADTVCEQNSKSLLDGFGHNDLQAAAEALCPEVTQARQWLEQAFGNSRMTGSGSAVFARVEENGAGNRPMATELEGKLPEGWVGRMCHSLVEHPLAGWAS